VSNIKVIRFISGEELIGEIVENKGTYELKNICQLAASYSDPTTATARIGLSPYMPYTNAKDSIVVDATFVAFIVDPVVDLLNEYNKIFGVGIIVPSEKDIIKPKGGSNAYVKI
jgi:hypothetical protein